MAAIMLSYLWQLLVLGQCIVNVVGKPHIVFIVADDLGWNDVGWHGAEIKTSVLDDLAREGVILDQAYVQQSCSPTRSAFMSGRYPFRTGLQHGVVKHPRPYGLPLNITTIAQRLKSAGYSTHAVGKWHLGFCNWSYIPTERGFDTFYGLYGGSADHFTHRKTRKVNKKLMSGLDFRRNRDVVRDMNGTYSTHAFGAEAVRIISEHNVSTPLYLYLPFQAPHAPLQAPKRYRNIKKRKRLVFAAMVTAMDEAIGNVTNALKQKGIWNNTFLVFTTDNGGQAAQGSSNWPLRGNKGSLWEGGTRGAAFVHGRMLNQTGYVNKEIIHAVDWYPTLLSLAGVAENDATLDGMNVWETLSNRAPSPRETFVYNLYKPSESPLTGAIRHGKWKLLLRPNKKFMDWYTPYNFSRVQPHLRNTTDTYLFDLATDPTERRNVADSHADIVGMMKAKLFKMMETYVNDLSTSSEPMEESDPANFGDTWSPGWC